MHTRIDEIIQFWMAEVPRENWFTSTPELDAEIKDKFLADYERAAAGHLAHWEETAEGALALLFLLDQFARNMFRGDARSFAADPVALGIAKRAISRDFDLTVPADAQPFFYLPFEHSEDLADQDRAIALMKERMPKDQNSLLHARVHREIIFRFGRFPYRNAVLGRQMTEKEQEFLDNGGYGEILKSLQKAR